MYQKYYGHFLKAHSKTLHLAAHSHHFWPDVTREAQLQYWDDSCQFADDKWGHFFSTAIPTAQKNIAGLLNISNSNQIVFATNTHEFVMRLFSCFEIEKKQITVLTTDSEFYSFERQAQRLGETGQVEIQKVAVEPFATFADRFAEAAQKLHPDMIFLSHVFFNSGWVCPLDRIIPLLPAQSLKVVDAYHSFMALPVDWSAYEKNIFYLSGSYKYAQGGEGCCFLYVPPNNNLRPAYTGWFAELSHLNAKDSRIHYPEDGLQFAGSTMDFSALYRLNAVFKLFRSEGLTLEKQHLYIQDMQKYFLTLAEKSNLLVSVKDKLIHQGWDQQGHFLTYELTSVDATQNLVQTLKKNGIWTDSRKNRIRFGFGLYVTKADLEKFIS